jgi:hypothetical protein
MQRKATIAERVWSQYHRQADELHKQSRIDGQLVFQASTNSEALSEQRAALSKNKDAMGRDRSRSAPRVASSDEEEIQSPPESENDGEQRDLQEQFKCGIRILRAARNEKRQEVHKARQVRDLELRKKHQEEEERAEREGQDKKKALEEAKQAMVEAAEARRVAALQNERAANEAPKWQQMVVEANEVRQLQEKAEALELREKAVATMEQELLQRTRAAAAAAQGRARRASAATAAPAAAIAAAPSAEQVQALGAGHPQEPECVQPASPPHPANAGHCDAAAERDAESEPATDDRAEKKKESFFSRKAAKLVATMAEGAPT